MRICCLWLWLCVANLAWAEVEYHDFKQPGQEQIYQSLITELRCLVCQNQTIADSNADLAKDLRRQVYEMVLKGQSKDEVVEYMTARYGDFVLYRPLFTLKTALLWLGPAAFLLTGLLVVLYLGRKKAKHTQPVSLSPAQQTHIREILEKGEPK
jgi:cytochrome c-type biogenesis protein CcmH